jgi:hypothetical protein
LLSEVLFARVFDKHKAFVLVLDQTNVKGPAEHNGPAADAEAYFLEYIYRNWLKILQVSQENQGHSFSLPCYLLT